MDHLSSARWQETLRREKRAKEKWQGKYLSPEEQQTMHEEDQAQAAALKENITVKNPNMPHGRLSERQANELRLAAYAEDGNAPAEPPPRPVSSYEASRRKVAEDVAAARQRSHRFTGDLSTHSMLRDIGPGLWGGINPGYTVTRSHFSSSSHSLHSFSRVRHPTALAVGAHPPLRVRERAPTCARREGVCLTTADLTRAPPPRLQREGWGEKVDKEHHLKMDGFMRHADKCLQLGEKPFVSGGMKGGAK